MRFSRSRTISRRIRLLHEYGKLVSKKLAMNVFGPFVFLAGFLLGAQHSSAQATSTSPLTAVDKVDLRRYADKWYGIARYPNRFRVTVNPTRLLSTGYEVTEKSKWSMRAVRRMGR
jgi:hypothetical protein